MAPRTQKKGMFLGKNIFKTSRGTPFDWLNWSCINLMMHHEELSLQILLVNIEVTQQFHINSKKNYKNCSWCITEFMWLSLTKSWIFLHFSEPLFFLLLLFCESNFWEKNSTWYITVSCDLHTSFIQCSIPRFFSSYADNYFEEFHEQETLWNLFRPPSKIDSEVIPRI